MSSTSMATAPAGVLEYLRTQHVLTLATASLGGLPHAATMLYVNDDLTFYFWSRPDTVTVRHVDANRAVAFTIGEYSPDWSQTKGVQASGECTMVLDPAEIRRVTELFARKYPALEPGSGTNLTFFRIQPTELNVIDNEGTTSGRLTLGAEFHRDAVFNVFRELPQAVAESVIGKLETVRVPSGEVIVRQGAPAEKFFIIVDGEVEVVRDDGGTTRLLNTLTSGQFFGELAILRDIPRSATVRSTRPTTLLTMDRNVFRGLVAQSLATTQDLDRVLQERLASPGAH